MVAIMSLKIEFRLFFVGRDFIGLHCRPGRAATDFTHFLKHSNRSLFLNIFWL